MSYLAQCSHSTRLYKIWCTQNICTIFTCQLQTMRVDRKDTLLYKLTMAEEAQGLSGIQGWGSGERVRGGFPREEQLEPGFQSKWEFTSGQGRKSTSSQGARGIPHHTWQVQ